VGFHSETGSRGAFDYDGRMSSSPSPKEWDAKTYQRVSEPQLRWGKKVLDTLVLDGDERVVDAGCGTGRLTELLLERLPRGHVHAVDRSENMLSEARARLEPRFGERVSFACADLAIYVASPPADVVFSTATFHWVLDHARLFASVRASLRAGGVLLAQCGGLGNLARAHAHAARIGSTPRFASHLAGAPEVWRFADAESTAALLAAAGFDHIVTGLEIAPTPFADAGALREFVENVVLRAFLARLANDAERAAYLDAFIADAAADDPPLTLDYVRLNIRARAS
jgi:trans-aconitate 2-methyltransferase